MHAVELERKEFATEAIDMIEEHTEREAVGRDIGAVVAAHYFVLAVVHLDEYAHTRQLAQCLLRLSQRKVAGSSEGLRAVRLGILRGIARRDTCCEGDEDGIGIAARERTAIGRRGEVPDVLYRVGDLRTKQDDDPRELDPEERQWHGSEAPVDRVVA